ncbi:MAG TPA: pantoate--beta-alanine ligase [Candidatus Acidoferrales bacterium]|jgi:pantoate--beta-alanine ligase|nr:pantoate--beta-alanine ligase [Candidatus Acidoferrales bacterium]
MEIIHTVSWMNQVAHEARLKEHVLGLVPTMGALHEGHISLIREAHKQCSPVAVSIFVNPKQFGPSEDFKKYPRTFDADRKALEELGVDYLFAPSPEEIYPKDFRTSVIVEGLSDRLEGKSRPGHFRGVTTVVLKLFEIVQPRLAFFGRKDAQQVLILQQMARDLNLDAEIVVCPIVREPDGLALSSRNVYLKDADRQAATVLHRSLQAAAQEICAGERNPAVILATLRKVIATEPRVELDYAEIADAESLEPLMTLARPAYLLLAARVGGTRLIDNAFIAPDGDGGFTVSI